MILGTRRVEQLEEDLKAVETKLPNEAIAKLDALYPPVEKPQQCSLYRALFRREDALLARCVGYLSDRRVSCEGRGIPGERKLRQMSERDMIQAGDAHPLVYMNMADSRMEPMPWVGRR